MSIDCIPWFFNGFLELFWSSHTLNSGADPYGSSNPVEFGSANVNNKSTQPNKWFGSANKKAIFGGLLTDF
jgi:hypothetical protein